MTGWICLDPEFSARVYEYEDVAAASLAVPRPDYPLIKTIAPGWDNDPRREGKGLVLHGATPAKYQAWLAALVTQANEKPFYGEPIICVNAWNEWGGELWYWQCGVVKGNDYDHNR